MTQLHAVTEIKHDRQPSIMWIQALRGIACLGVVLTHARYFMFDTPDWALADQMLLPGAAGVDLFFVISGFIMAYTAWGDGPDGAAPFLFRRIARVWPPLVVMTIIWIYALNGGTQTFRHWDSLRLFLGTVFFLPVNPHRPPFFDMVLPLAWTLVFEMYFYVMFALSMLFGKWRWIALHTWVAATVIVFPMSLRGLNMDTQLDLGLPSYMNVMTSPLVLEFIFGVWAAFLYRSSWRIKSERVCWHLLVIVPATALWLCFAGVLTFHGPGRWGMAAAALVMTLALVSKSINLNPPRVLVWLGTISYSLYLTHTCTQQLLIRYVEGHGISSHNWMFILYSSIICCVIAWPYHEVVETRLTNLFRRILKVRPSEVAVVPASKPGNARYRL